MTTVPKTKRFLFIGFAHSATDTRLFHFMAKAVRERYPTVECLYLGRDSRITSDATNRILTVIPMPNGIKASKRRIRRHDLERIATYIRELGIDLVQVSDATELTLARKIKEISAIPVIYDSHEDYFNQSYEYSGKSLWGLVKGTRKRLREILFVRHMDAVFCTDDFLERLYKQPLFDARSVDMVRNIPPRRLIRKHAVYHDRDHLKLVYIGSVNAIRGIIEVAQYCRRFNDESSESRHHTSLSFHVFSRHTNIIEKLVNAGTVIHHGFVPHAVIENRISDFDIGVSLIMPSKKFERNILIKNFEYMAMGIPILTSNYGTMKRYVSESDAGLTIDPMSYDAFKAAILKFRDVQFRKTCGENGIRYATQHFHRDKEVVPYLETVGRLLDLTPALQGHIT